RVIRNGNQEMELLGMVVRRDRRDAGLTQQQLDELLYQHAKRYGVRHIKHRFTGGIERGIFREVSAPERRLFAFCLGQSDDRYLGLETNPSRVILGLLKHSAREDLPAIERAIEFPPEYKQAGIGILSYFSEVLAKKYPNEDIRVSILQAGNKVTLRIET